MVPTLDAMLLRIRAKAMEGDQETIRCLLRLFDTGSLETSMARRSKR